MAEDRCTPLEGEYAEVFQEIFGESVEEVQAHIRTFTAASQERLVRAIRDINDARAKRAESPPGGRKGILGLSARKEDPHG